MEHFPPLIHHYDRFSGLLRGKLLGSYSGACENNSVEVYIMMPFSQGFDGSTHALFFQRHLA